jgi:hypothetical protein
MIVLFFLTCGTLAAVPAAATADFISYSLNQSNTLPDGVAYGTVKVESNTGLGEVKLTFSAASDPYNSLGPNFGFHTIGFNTDLDLKAANFTLPAGWKLTGGRQPEQLRQVHLESQHQQQPDGINHRANRRAGRQRDCGAFRPAIGRRRQRILCGPGDGFFAEGV